MSSSYMAIYKSFFSRTTGIRISHIHHRTRTRLRLYNYTHSLDIAESSACINSQTRNSDSHICRPPKHINNHLAITQHVSSPGTANLALATQRPRHRDDAQQRLDQLHKLRRHHVRRRRGPSSPFQPRVPAQDSLDEHLRVIKLGLAPALPEPLTPPTVVLGGAIFARDSQPPPGSRGAPEHPHSV